jgi:hypothetical protein
VRSIELEVIGSSANLATFDLIAGTVHYHGNQERFFAKLKNAASQQISL